MSSLLSLQVFTSPTRPIRGPGNRTFSPITSTLISGDADAVLVDAQFLREDVEALGDMIDATGRNLTTIFITHGHGDHYFGANRLVERFPGARVVATAGVIDYIAAHRDQDIGTSSAMFGDQIVVPTTAPSPLEGDVLELEGHELRVIKLEQGDIAPTTALHIPSIGAVIAGDVAYNGIHQMLGFSGPAEWSKWIASIEVIESLNPKTVVAGHKRPELDDEATRVLGSTRDYIRDFAAAAASAGSVDELVGTIQSKYPDHGNLTTLVYSANAAMSKRIGEAVTTSTP